MTTCGEDATPGTTSPRYSGMPWVIGVGDTLAIIADKAGVTVEALATENDIETDDDLVIGTILTIP